MKKMIIACLVVAGLSACTSEVKEKAEGTLAALSYTLYSDKTEIFVEFKPLVVGHTSKFATHVTLLGENFRPCINGSVTVSLIVDDNGIRNVADTPSSPGIFRLALQPKMAGMGQLVFDIITPDFKDRIVIDSVQVYPDLTTAKTDEPVESAAGSEITYLKEQAWKVEFANTVAELKPIHNVVHTSGQILSAPGDESTIAAQADGVVKFVSSSIVAGLQVRQGQALFTLSGGGITNNIDAAVKTAQAEFSKAKSDYERATELIKDRLISQKEFEDIKLRYQTAQTRLNTLSGNYGASGKTITAPISGYLTDVVITEGQYVTAGQALATVSQNKRINLRAEVPQRKMDKMSGIQSANFITQGNKQYSTTEMNGKLLSVGKSTARNSAMIPVNFEMDNVSGLIPGAVVEVYLLSGVIENALAIPVSALIEEQGKFYAYVQTAGESFEKRELSLGINNGNEVQVLRGIVPGERVVTKGAYQIKLATASGTMPAHGHEH
jgi:membrane fusion protein, heavy metal efflux system